jgi:hypothetical protein
MKVKHRDTHATGGHLNLDAKRARAQRCNAIDACHSALDGKSHNYKDIPWNRINHWL